jgi:uncharacterized membrane protein YjgN (DUF898 family)
VVFCVDWIKSKLLWKVVSNIVETLVEVVIFGFRVPWANVWRFGSSMVSKKYC